MRAHTTPSYRAPFPGGRPATSPPPPRRFNTTAAVRRVRRVCRAVTFQFPCDREFAPFAFRLPRSVVHVCVRRSNFSFSDFSFFSFLCIFSHRFVHMDFSPAFLPENKDDNASPAVSDQ